VISEGASTHPAPASIGLRLVRNAAIACAAAAVVAALVGVLIGHAGAGGALATGLALGALNGALAGKLLRLPVPFIATSLMRLLTLSMIGVALGLAFGLTNMWLVVLGVGVAQVVLAAVALRETMRVR
jgi:hypothetical protein